MGAQANWGLAALDLSDPADTSGLKSGLQIDVAKASADYMADLKVTLRRESNYGKMFSIACGLKWAVADGDRMDRNPCRTCPEFTKDPDNMKSLLCSLGREQEDIIDLYYACFAAEQIDATMLAAFEVEADSAQELAEALL